MKSVIAVAAALSLVSPLAVPAFADAKTKSVEQLAQDIIAQHLSMNPHAENAELTLKECIYEMVSEGAAPLPQQLSLDGSQPPAYFSSFWRVDLAAFDFTTAQVIEGRGIHRAQFTKSEITDHDVATARALMRIAGAARPDENGERVTAPIGDQSATTKQFLLRGDVGDIYDDQIRELLASADLTFQIGNVGIVADDAPSAPAPHKDGAILFRQYEVARNASKSTVVGDVIFLGSAPAADAVYFGGVKVGRTFGVAASSREELDRAAERLRAYQRTVCPE